jgi:hypothetical protein
MVINKGASLAGVHRISRTGDLGSEGASGLEPGVALAATGH